jgi:hypothetical protein
LNNGVGRPISTNPSAVSQMAIKTTTIAVIIALPHMSFLDGMVPVASRALFGGT